ncbi:MAG: hypothetical protein U0894_07110 [Pirellulales bacterium]
MTTLISPPPAGIIAQTDDWASRLAANLVHHVVKLHGDNVFHLSVIALADQITRSCTASWPCLAQPPPGTILSITV